MKRTTTLILLLLAGVVIFSACGGGGGGTMVVPPAVQPTKAVLTLATAGTNTSIYGIDITVELPEGVTVKSTVSPPETDAGVATASGEASSGTALVAMYTAATGTFKGRVRLALVNATGFSTGEFSTLKCDIANGHSPLRAGFSLENFVASGKTGETLPGLTAGLTVDFQ